MALDYLSGLTFSLGGLEYGYTRQVRHVPTYYGIQFEYAGTIRVRIDQRTEVVMSGPCAFITHPHAFFEYGPAEGRPIHHNFVCFFGPRVKSFLSGGLLDLNPESPLVRIAQPLRFFQILSELVKLVQSRQSNLLAQARMTLMLEDLLLQIQESRMQAGNSETLVEIRELIVELDQSPEREWDFSVEARRIGITPEHLRRVFRRAAGMPPQQYLIRQRMKLAAAMLVSSVMSVSEVGRRVGIADEYYFSRLFKQHYAISPRRYRSEFMDRAVC